MVSHLELRFNKRHHQNQWPSISSLVSNTFLEVAGLSASEPRNKKRTNAIYSINNGVTKSALPYRPRKYDHTIAIYDLYVRPVFCFLVANGFTGSLPPTSLFVCLALYWWQEQIPRAPPLRPLKRTHLFFDNYIPVNDSPNTSRCLVGENPVWSAREL